jgi:hypothetical protein
MNKKQIHHPWQRLNLVKPWYFLVLALFFGLLSIYGLRHNNLTMVHLREKVYQADQNNGDVEGSLRNLRQYVYAHMNTDLASGNNAIYPPIQLKYSYDRALQAIKDAGGDKNSKIYTDAQNECEREHPQGLYGAGRIPCIQGYLATHSIQASSAVPTASLYEFDFVSPRWSADLPGISLVLTTVFGLLFVGRWVSERWLRADLRG